MYAETNISKVVETSVMDVMSNHFNIFVIILYIGKDRDSNWLIGCWGLDCFVSYIILNI